MCGVRALGHVSWPRPTALPMSTPSRAPRRLPDGFLPALRARLEALYGARLVRAVLFGSYARGEATDESDVDILVVLRGSVSRSDEAWPLSGVAVDLQAAFRLPVSFLVLSESEAAEADMPLLENVRQEGREVVA